MSEVEHCICNNPIPSDLLSRQTAPVEHSKEEALQFTSCLVSLLLLPESSDALLHPRRHNLYDFMNNGKSDPFAGAVHTVTLLAQNLVLPIVDDFFDDSAISLIHLVVIFVVIFVKFAEFGGPHELLVLPLSQIFL